MKESEGTRKILRIPTLKNCGVWEEQALFETYARGAVSSRKIQVTAKAKRYKEQKIKTQSKGKRTFPVI